MRKLILLLGLMALSFSCVKDEGVVAEGSNATGTTTGSTSGGSSTGGSSTGSSSQTDPLLSESWHYHIDGTSTVTGYSSEAAANDTDINVKLVHDVSGIKGEGVRIAVSDTGVEINHPDLAANTLAGEHRSYVYNDPGYWDNSDPTPGAGADEPHGTSVAGLISAVGWNGIGSRGIAPLSKFAAFKYVFSPLTYNAATLLAKEIDQLNGDFDIFNQSFGRAGYFFVSTDPQVDLTLRANTVGIPGTTPLRDGKGAIYIQAAGNSFSEPYCYPGPCAGPLDALSERTASGNTNAHEELSSPFKIVVGALSGKSDTTHGMKASYSTIGSSIWVSAPGGEDGISKPAMITTDISSCQIGYSIRSFLYPDLFNFGFHTANSRCDYTNIFNGTSAATPIVSGVVALMLDANPNLTWRDVKHILATTSDKVDLPSPIPTLNSYYTADPSNKITSEDNLIDPSVHVYDYKWVQNAKNVRFSNRYGFGKVNAYAAVQAAMAYTSNSLGTFVETKTPSTPSSEGTWYYDSGNVNQVITTATSGVSSKIWVGHNFEVEHVQIELTTTHTFSGDLAIILTSPSGTESRLLTINNQIFGGALTDFRMSSNAFYSEESEGFWTLKIIDGGISTKNISYNPLTSTYTATTGSGNLTRWKINISGHRKASEINNPLPPTGIIISDVSGSTTTSFSFSPSQGALATTQYEVGIFTPAGAAVHPYQNIGSSTNFTAPAGLLVGGTVYQFRVRAKEPSSPPKYSSVQAKEWTEQP